DRPELREALLEGDSSFDRVVAASRITTDTTDPLFRHLDVAGVRREAARRREISSDEERRTFLDRFLVLQPSLDESWWKIFGGLDGMLGAVVDKALTEAVDQLPEDPEAPKDSAWRRATALALIAAGDGDTPAQVTVFVDADQAASSGRAGVYVESGPRIGQRMLQAILCDAVTEVVGVNGDGTPLRYGRRSRTIPPSLRRAIIHRDGNRCAITGCGSRNRLQVHHITPWSQGGRTDPDNLITLCWYHHHIAVHQHGLTPIRDPKTRRWTLTRRDRSPPWDRDSS
ncbi:MAG TPA: HNH endonuclease, partial [Acidimicrobiia bacterium]